MTGTLVHAKNSFAGWQNRTSTNVELVKGDASEEGSCVEDPKFADSGQGRPTVTMCPSGPALRAVTCCSRVASHVAEGFPPVESCLGMRKSWLQGMKCRGPTQSPIVTDALSARDVHINRLIPISKGHSGCGAARPGWQEQPCGVTSRSSLKNSLSKRNFRSQVQASPGLAFSTQAAQTAQADGASWD